MNADLQKKIEDALRNPQNLGELPDADAVGTAGSAGCGDMIRLWLKFKNENGRRVIDRATFQSFGCETAIAVASLATEVIRGKTAEEALALSSEDLTPGLGPLPPIKIHCSQLVESALHSALGAASTPRSSTETATAAPSLLENMTQPAQKSGKIKIVLLDGSDVN